VSALLCRRNPELEVELRHHADRVPLVTTTWAGACVHVDDFSGIAMRPDDPLAHACFGSRAFARAGLGDLVIGRCGPLDDYLAYLELQLGLGPSSYLEIRDQRCGAANLFDAILEDERAQLEIAGWAGKRGGRVALHPYMGHARAWRLAASLDRICGSTVMMLAPPPSLTALVNNRSWFAELVGLALGPEFALYGHTASDLNELVERVARLADHAEVIAVRLCDSASGAGLIRIEASLGRRGYELRSRLAAWIAEVGWTRASPALSVERWETNVLASPSAQVWIPNLVEGPPVIDGIFDQQFDPHDPGVFVGSGISQMPAAISDSIAEKTLALSRVLQELGYIGRCSFDTIVCGETLEGATLRFVECNGRWGGTSSPMVLVHRLFKNHSSVNWTAGALTIATRPSFSELVRALGDRLYRRDGRGWVILNNPACLTAVGTIDVITVGRDQSQAEDRQRIVRESIRERFG